MTITTDEYKSRESRDSLKVFWNYQELDGYIDFLEIIWDSLWIPPNISTAQDSF